MLVPCTICRLFKVTHVLDNTAILGPWPLQSGQQFSDWPQHAHAPPKEHLQNLPRLGRPLRVDRNCASLPAKGQRYGPGMKLREFNTALLLSLGPSPKGRSFASLAHASTCKTFGDATAAKQGRAVNNCMQSRTDYL